MNQYTIEPILKHLLRGSIKSIPFAGSLIEELIYGPLDEHNRANEAKKLYGVLDQIQGQMKTLEEIIDFIANSSLNYNSEVQEGLRLLTSSISYAKQGDFKGITPAIMQAYYMSLTHAPLNVYLADLYDEMRLWRGLSMPTPVGIEDIYVPTTVSINEQGKNHNFEIANTIDDLLQKQLGIRHFLIQGSPGSGKSTLLHHLVTTHIDLFNQSLSEKIPIFLHLPIVERLCIDAGNWNLSIADVIARRACHLGNSSFSNALCKTITDVVHTGNALIFLDAVDEVSYNNHLRIKTWLEDVYRSASQCNIIITSRPISIIDGLRGFHAFYVQPFNANKQDHYIVRWFECVKIPQLAGEMIKYLERPENYVIRGISALAGNPLFLTMMCIEYMRDGEISRTPAVLIDNFTKYLLEELDKEKGVEHSRQDIGLDLLRRTLELIASDYFEANETSFFHGSLVRKIGKIIQEYGRHISVTPEMFLDDLALESGLLREDWHGEWHFSHTLFQEFFTARYHWRKQYEEHENQAEWLNSLWFHPDKRRYEHVKRFYTELSHRREVVGNDKYSK